MTELDLPLHGPALYNPHLLSKKELLGLFSARQALLEELLDDIRSTPSGEPAQHHLVLGQRGMGKTMLLRRIQFAVEDDPELRDRWLALSFPEEQYNVAALSDFWLNCIDALSDTLERHGSSHSPEGVKKVVEGLDDAVEVLRKEAEDVRADRALDILASAASALDRRLLLLVDNADLVLDRIGKQDWALREVLSSQPAVTFLGASATAIESTYEYDKAFYDFFRIHSLTGLTVEETRILLLQYAEAQGNDEVGRIVEEEPGRLRTLHTLTGGNPRTLVLLFNIFVQGPDGDVRSDIERLLDQCTPLYKARFEALPAQAQQVVDALALEWDPVSAGELAEHLRLPVNNVSAQLNRLANQGVVVKVPYEPESKTGFQIAERFFNIWYLMRASRRVRRRLLWLVEFLRMFYTQDELRRRVERHLRLGGELAPRDRLRHAEYSFALAAAFDEGPLRGVLERSALQMLVGYDDLGSEVRELVEVEGVDPGLKSRAEYLERFEALRGQLIDAVKQDKIAALLAEDLLRAPIGLERKESITEELCRAEGSAQSASIPEALPALATFSKSLEALGSSDKGVKITLQAIENRHMTSFDDVEGALVAEAALGVQGLVSVAAAIRYVVTKEEKDLATLVDSLEHAMSPFPWLLWISQAGSTADTERLEYAIGRVWNLASEDAALMAELGNILVSYVEMPGEAERALWKAIEIDPSLAKAWLSLGGVLRDRNAINEAIEAYRRGTELMPENAWAWGELASCFQARGSLQESEAALGRAVQLEPGAAVYWAKLASVLYDQGQIAEMLEPLRKATEAEPTVPSTWRALALLLFGTAREDEAEEALRSGMEMFPQDAKLKASLARLLFDRNRGLDEAEELARTATSSEDGGPEEAHTLACILVRKGKWNNGVEPARRFLHAWIEDLPEGHWPDVTTFFREATKAGRAREAADLLDELELGERWRPLREALEALALDNPKYLRRVAPEVREPAEAILAELTRPTKEET